MRSFTAFLLILLFISPLVLAKDVFEDQIKLYDRDDINSIHKRLYTKKGRHEVSLNTGGIFNNSGYSITNLQYQYHFFESFGFEALNAGIGVQFGDNDKLYFYQASASFSPIYGKISLFTWAVLNYDLYVIGGGGVVKYSGLQDGTSFMGNVGIGQRFFINEYLSTKIEFRDYIFEREAGNDSQIFHNYSLTAGISLLIPFTQSY